MLYGSCCCACREGSGVVVHRSAAGVAGPWTRQARDVNCRADAPICAGMAPEAPLAKQRPVGQLTIAAQGIGLSVLGDTYLWSGSRWLSAADNPPGCNTLCRAPTGACAPPAGYVKGHDFEYWIPLAFDDATGDVRPFAPFVDAFELELPS